MGMTRHCFVKITPDLPSFQRLCLQYLQETSNPAVIRKRRCTTSSTLLFNVDGVVCDYGSNFLSNEPIPFTSNASNAQQFLPMAPSVPQATPTSSSTLEASKCTEGFLSPPPAPLASEPSVPFVTQGTQAAQILSVSWNSSVTFIDPFRRVTGGCKLFGRRRSTNQKEQ